MNNVFLKLLSISVCLHYFLGFCIENNYSVPDANIHSIQNYIAHHSVNFSHSKFRKNEQSAILNPMSNPTIANCDTLIVEVDQNCSVSLTLRNIGTQSVSCDSSGTIRWQIFIDLEADGNDDWEFSSFLPVNNDVENANSGQITEISDDNGNEVPDIYVAPTQNGEEVSVTLPFQLEGANHNLVVTWKVIDDCQMQGICEQTILIQDRIPPDGWCVSLSTALMHDPDGQGPLKHQVELYAIDFTLLNKDNCTNTENLLYTFDHFLPQITDTIIDDRLINIDSMHFFDANGGVEAYPTNNVHVLEKYYTGQIQLWHPEHNSATKVWPASIIPEGENKINLPTIVNIWDESKNVDSCTVATSFNCNNCGNPPNQYMISGNISTENGIGLDNALVVIDRDQPLYPISLTSVNGFYSFNNLNKSDSISDKISVRIDYEKPFDQGVSTIDLVHLQRHIMQIQNFNSPYKLIAADVNDDQKINTIDLVELRKLILGVSEKFQNHSWRFPVANLPMDTNQVTQYSEEYHLNVDKNLTSVNFVAVKIGDLNESALRNFNTHSVESRTQNPLRLITKNTYANQNEFVSIDITSDNFNDVFGFQGTMKFTEAEFESIIPGVLPMTEANVGRISKNMVSLSYASPVTVSIEKNEVLFTILIKLNSTGNISDRVTLTSDITLAESYVGKDMKTERLDLFFSKPEESASFTLFQNEPNPFKETTEIKFKMPQSGKATLKVFDNTGRLIYQQMVDAVKGLNTVALTHDQLRNSGMMYYQLYAENWTGTKRMILIE